MAKFEAGNDPADHTNAEVVEFLKGDEVTSDEYDRVMEAERGNRARVGILNLTGVDDTAPVSVEEAAGPNERATGQESPADQAKEVDDPNASGDAGTTAEPYPLDAPAQLGPEQPQSEAEAQAHAATLAAADAAEVSSLVDANAEPVRKTQTPDEARALASKLAKRYQPSEQAASSDDE